MQEITAGKVQVERHHSNARHFKCRLCRTARHSSNASKFSKVLNDSNTIKSTKEAYHQLVQSLLYLNSKALNDSNTIKKSKGLNPNEQASGQNEPIKGDT
jgi:hypothetical protein